LKATDKSHVRGAALDVIVAVDGKKALPLLISALKNNDRAYRVNALRLSESIADESWYATVAKTLQGKAVAPVKADILNWLGTNHVASQIDAVVAQMSAADAEVALAAIKAAGKIGGDVALESLIAQLGG
jgi:HEAT repeat protein